MKKFHISIAVEDISKSIDDYSSRLGKEPDSYIEGEYALWRTQTLNFSVRFDKQNSGQLRHLGWEDEKSNKFTEEEDVNGIIWESFSAAEQAEEINILWPEASYKIS